MDGQPIALKGGYQGGDLCINVRDDGGQSDSQKSKWNDKNPYDLLPVFELPEACYSNLGASLIQAFSLS